MCTFLAVSSTAEMTAAAVPRATPLRRLGARTNRRAAYAAIAALSLAAAVLSLRFPSTPTYDPWSWLVWGREIVHLSLSTAGGPSWKPLPVLFTTLFAPFGTAAPDLWLVVARAGGIAALALAALLGLRLMMGMRARPAAGLIAAVAAVCAVSLMPQYVDYVALGESEGLLAAAVLMVALRHLDGAPRAALFWCFVVSLDRPEAWPLFILYAIYVWRGDREGRRLVVLFSCLILPLWFVPELLGSGSLARGVQTAQHPRPEAATFARCPFCTEITDHALRLVAPPFWLAALALAVLLGGRVRRRGAASRTETVIIAAAAAGLLWFLEEAALTETGFSGNNRYLVGAAALVMVVGVVAWVAALDWLALRLRARRHGRGLILILLAALIAATTLALRDHVIHVSTASTEASLRFQASLRRDLPHAIARAGGANALLVCGDIETNPSEAPLAAWAANLPLAAISKTQTPVIIRSPNAPAAEELPSVPPGAGYRAVARAGEITIYTSCAR